LLCLGLPTLGPAVSSCRTLVRRRRLRRLWPDTVASRIAVILMLALFRRKVFLNPMGTKLYLSVAHSHDVCDRFLDRFADALQAGRSGRE